MNSNRKKILLTGANGYIGMRLLPVLLKEYDVYCCVRDKSRFKYSGENAEYCEAIEVDFLFQESLINIPRDINAAYFLMHSMSSTSSEFEKMEEKVARNFVKRINETQVEHVVYLGGILNDKLNSSKHLSSRNNVANILKQGKYNLTVLGAGIIVGSGSSSFEIMRDLVEKLPVMVAPKWLLTKSQYISVRNVIEFLSKVLFYENAYNQSFDICGPNVMNYRQMLKEFGEVRGLKRWFIQIPFLSPHLSSYWLYFVTATSFNLAKSLVGSMKVEIIGKPNTLHTELVIELIDFKQAVADAFTKIEQNMVSSSWKDSIVSGRLAKPISSYINVPVHGCFYDIRKRKIVNYEFTIDKIWSIGGENGWYYGTWLWQLRGFVDKVFGGVGLRRGRTHLHEIEAGDALDFWRVIYADKEDSRLLLYAEMKLPGEAWLEFKIENNTLIQTATFRPKGILGRLYWFMVFPFHNLIFNGMAGRLVKL